MTNFYETVLTVLKTDERFVAEDGTFLEKYGKKTEYHGK